MAELVDVLDLESSVERRPGSSPGVATSLIKQSRYDQNWNYTTNRGK